MLAKERRLQLEDLIKATLSDYENCVLNLFLDGMSYAEIAGELGKTEKSINNALQRIRTKLNASAR